MMPLEAFHFLRPGWLLLLPLLVVLLWLMFKRRLGSRSWEAICDRHLLPYMLIGGSRQSRHRPLVLLGTCGLLAIVSLAGPVWEKLPQPVFNPQSALVIALDLSRSMDANDISPSRLSRARFKVADILNQNQEGQVALLVYAADAFTVTPLTDDMATMASQLPALTTDIMPAQGNRSDLALEKARELLTGAGHSRGDILLISDEIDLPRVESLAADLRREGYRISVLGVGTGHGSPVLMEDGSFLKDARGEIVIPVLDEQPMRALAQVSGGYYRRMTANDTDIQYLLERMSRHASMEESASTEFETDVWREQGPWLLLLLIPLAALGFRRGYLVLLVALVLPLPQPAEAFDWDSLWLRADQRGERQLQEGNAEAAAELFADPAWKGIAHYRAGNFEAAAGSLQGLEDVENLYNAGNALARLGQYEEAIARYDEVLSQAPDHADAKFNRKLLQDELQKQQQQQQDQQGQDQQEQESQNQARQEQQQRDRADQQGASQDEQQKDQQSGEAEQGGDPDQQRRAQQDQQAQQEQQQAEQNEQQPAQADNEDQAPQQNAAEQQAGVARTTDDEIDEAQQATEQWLRRIPDDPAGLLRRKFLYQYQQGKRPQDREEKTW